MSTEEEIKRISQLKSQRKGHKGRVTYFRNQCVQGTIVSLEDFESVLSRLKITYNKYDEVQSEIEGYTDDFGDRFIFEDEYGSLESAILKEIKKIKMAECEEVNKSNTEPVGQVNVPNNLGQVQTVVPVKLPEIKLPKFNGTHMDWLQFRNRFGSLIHDNNNLDPVTKFQYLLSSIEEGKALSLVADLNLTKENYDVAWNLIVENYDNEVAIQKEHMAQIYDIEKPKDGSSESLENFVNTVLKHIAALRSLKINVDGWDLFLNHHLLARLDQSSRNEVIKKSASKKIPTLAEFVSILKDRVKFLKEVKASNVSSHQQNPLKDKFVKDRSSNYKPLNTKLSFTSSVRKCAFCQGDHLLSDCKKFANPENTPRKRYDFVKSKSLCGNCLNGHHRISECNRASCNLCNLRHHVLLHFGSTSFWTPNAESTYSSVKYDPSKRSAAPNTSSSSVNQKTSSNVTVAEENICVSASSQSKVGKTCQILLATAVIKVRAANGQETLCRALLDSGSQSNFITSKVCNLLNARKSEVSIPVTGINQNLSLIKHKLEIQVESRLNNFVRRLECLVLPKITGVLPSSPVKFDFNAIPRNVELADPSFYSPNDIDMLIGAEIFNEIMTGDKIELIKELPPFQNTVFGYVLSGKVNFDKDSTISLSSIENVSLFCCHLDELNTQVKRFWTIEQIPNANEMSLEEKKCEKHYQDNVSRDESGRYSVALPFKSNISQIGESSWTSSRQFSYLEKRLVRDSNLRNQYVDFMHEYLSMDHMEPVEDPGLVSNELNKGYYLPHHAVLRESSSTTKLRVVFNASSKTTTNLSLNDCMMVGPTIQQDLFSIVLRFRKYKVALTGDIAKMYRQIRVRVEDRDFLRIWWRDNPDEKLQCYRLSTVTYGTGPAPFLAIRSLKQLSDDESHTFPNASVVLQRDFYVDDLLTGADNIIDAEKLKQDLIKLLELGCFELRKIGSNLSQLSDHSEISSDKENATSILGIHWNKSSDDFEISFQKFDPLSLCTKRKVLSEIAQLFDPVGLCAPMIFIAKLFLQSLWAIKDLSWDDELPPSMINEWRQFKEEMIIADKITVPRCVTNVEKIKSIELHGFGDASEKGYGCSIYIRVVDESDNCRINLLCAKSRVAPLKKQTVPRLELCASLLLAQLMNKVLAAIEINFDQIFYWSDSEISILRIKSPPSKFCTFVANRVSQIQDLSSPELWFYVPTELNPSDIVSRGLRPSELKESRMWWKGPDFLRKPIEEWPQPKNSKIDPATLELRKNEEISLPSINVEFQDYFLKFSSYLKILRIAAICLRIKGYVRFPERTINKQDATLKLKPVSASEIENAMLHYVKFIQSSEYEKEISTLKENATVSSKSKLKHLSPFLDDGGILRVGGRLRNSDLSNERKHPILLPFSHRFSRLIIEYEHHRNLHCGPQSLLYHVRQHFWITGARNLCRKVVHECVRCFRTRPQTLNQVIGQLPEKRVRMSRPFQVVGVDFCGPFMLKYKIRTKVMTKVYVCVFICFSTKAIHMEVVTDLTTVAFIAALRRFVGRRGIPSHIYSDNATNFVGAKSELADLNRLFRSEVHNNELLRNCADIGIEWQTIPPRSPHFGGLWEAAVKSAKYHLKRVVGTSAMTFEELHTLIVQIESCLNSRPLTPISSDPSDLRCLTPGHFLIGSPLNAIPDSSLQHLDFNRLASFQRVQHLFQQFWKRWSLEYLSELQQAKKWFKPQENVKVDSIVLLKDENTPPLTWNLARVTEVHKGSDGYVRVVTVKSGNSVFKRTIAKICLLPIVCDNVST